MDGTDLIAENIPRLGTLLARFVADFCWQATINGSGRRRDKYLVYFMLQYLSLITEGNFRDDPSALSERIRKPIQIQIFPSDQNQTVTKQEVLERTDDGPFL